MAPTAVRSPLTFGQLSVLRALQQLPVESWWQTYVCKSVELLPTTAISDVMAALEVVAQRHDSLRTNFVETPDEMTAVTLPHGPLPVEVIEMPEAAVDEVERVAQGRCSAGFQWDAEFAWRAYVFTTADAPRHLVLVLDHMLVDGLGSHQLMAELRALLRGDDAEGSELLAASPRQPHELAQAQRSPRWDARRRATDQYWDHLLAALPVSVFPWPPGAAAGRIEAILNSPRARRALGHVAARLRITPQSVMLALTAIAVASACGEDDVVLTLQANNRYDRRWRHIVSSMNQATPLPVAVGRAAGTFESFAREVHFAGLNAYRHGSYDVDAIAQKVRRARGVDLEFDLYFNFMAYDVSPNEGAFPADLAGPTVELPTPRRQTGQRIDVKIREGEAMPIAVRVDPTLVPAARLSHLMYWFDDELLRLAGGDPVRVRDARARAG